VEGGGGSSSWAIRVSGGPCERDPSGKETVPPRGGPSPYKTFSLAFAPYEDVDAVNLILVEPSGRTKTAISSSTNLSVKDPFEASGVRST